MSHADAVTQSHSTPPPTTPPLTNEFRLIPLDQIKPSATNPRKHFDGPELDELTADVRSRGVLVPILVRPWSWEGAHPNSSLNPPSAEIGKKFELIAGERRFRAATRAGLKEIPAVVKEMTDQQALEAQMVENLQRQDLSPMEEARGFRDLLDSMKRAEPKAKVEELVKRLGERVHKAARTVWEKLKLVELVPEVAKAIEEGKITASHGILIVRLPEPLQKKALDECFEDEYVGGKKVKNANLVGVRELKSRIASEFQVDLSRAPWKLSDAAFPNAGACSSCKKNAANDPLAESSKPICQDPVCFKSKRETVIGARMAEARGAFKDATGREPKEVFKLGGDYNYCHDEHVRQFYDWHHNECKVQACESVQVGVIVSGDRLGQTAYFCDNNRCKVHHPEAAKAAAKEKKADPKAEEKRRQAEAFAEVADRALYLAIVNKANQFDQAAFQVLYRCVLEDRVCDDGSVEADRAICEAMGWTVPSQEELENGALQKVLTREIPKVKTKDLPRLVTALTLAATFSGVWRAELEDPAKLFKVDAKAVRAKAIEAAKKEQAAAAKKTETSAAKSSPNPKAKPAAKSKAKKGGR